MTSGPPDTWFRKGFGLGAAVQQDLDAAYAGSLVDRLRANDDRLTVGEVTVRLAKELGFCYGVERAVEYAYQTRRKFPDRRLHLLGEIIHNPHVNATLRGMGIEIMEPRADTRDGEPRFDYETVRPDDVVILPAFGVTIADFQALRAHGCIVVDTTCGSVLNVWKRVEAYARDGLTSLLHGKYYHEETRATASQVLKYPGGSYLVVRDMREAELVIEYIAGLGAGRIDDAARTRFLTTFARAVSPGFDPDVHLRRIGVANQTTMLARESLAIGERVGEAMAAAWGADHRASNFRTFDTICSATQDRQDAVQALLDEQPDVMIVVGGFNSSNTISLAALCAERVPTYHVEDAEGIDPATHTLHYRLAQVKHAEADAVDWLPPGPVTVGITAGASTPNNKIGEAMARVFATRGLRP
ncbi:MAG: 4-hydroxy-3-methylbut-2-enyl diphosphate reductase [Gemmatimonadaceae bacterium]|nr:4-hydroxy-3-methylbut-2-enyl diphosphate reductase [Gemmatimonadaceae bacterium]